MRVDNIDVGLSAKDNDTMTAVCRTSLITIPMRVDNIDVGLSAKDSDTMTAVCLCLQNAATSQQSIVPIVGRSVKDSHPQWRCLCVICKLITIFARFLPIPGRTYLYMYLQRVVKNHAKARMQSCLYWKKDDLYT